jgi:hypothetical protein
LRVVSFLALKKKHTILKYFICLSFVFLLSSSFTSVDPNQFKVDVVHNGKTISVGPLAMLAHLAHGDSRPVDPNDSGSNDPFGDGE